MPRSGEPTADATDVGERESPDAGPAPALPEGTAVDRYIIVQPLGRGGMGVVYVAHDPELDRRVALKLLRAELVTGGKATIGRNRLVREAHAMAKLNHPNVVGIYDAGIYGEQVFLAVELVEGSDVAHWLSTPRTWREVLEVFAKAGRGLAAAHAAGLVHRDFKPENVLLGKNGEVKVADFGLARAAGVAQPAGPPVKGRTPSEPLSTRLTEVGLVTGTPGFIAPEQLVGKPSDARGDQFSFCVALYEGLYRERPFEGSPLAGKPVAEPPKGTQVPAWVRRVVLRGLSLRPESRFASIAELLEALADDPAVRRRRFLQLAGMVALLIGAVGGTALVLLRQRAAADPCHAPASRLAGAWDDGIRRQTRAAFLATGDPQAATTVAYAEKAMDHATGTWLAAYADACAATRQRHTQPEAALQLRLECLDDQRLDLQAAAELMLHPEAGKLTATIGAASSLPLPSECADASALSVVDRPAAALRATFEALRLRLARGRAAFGAAKYAEARDLFTRLAEDAHAASATSLEAEAQLGLGQVSLAPDRDRPSAEYGLKAFRLAEIVHRDQLAARAAAQVVTAQTLLGDPRAEVDASVARAEDALLRAGPGGTGDLELQSALRYVELYRGHAEATVKYGRQALALAAKLFGDQRPETLGALDSLAASLDDLGDYDEELALYERAVAGSDALLGPTNAQAALPQKNIVEMRIDLGRVGEAAPLVPAMFSRLSPNARDELMAELLAVQGRIYVEQGDVERGLTFVRRGLEMGAELKVLDTPDSLELLQYASEAYLLAGQSSQAVNLFEHHIAGQDIEPRSPRWVTYLRLAGWGYLDAGQPQRALPVLERALMLSVAHPFYPGWVARLRYQLAKTLLATHGDRNRAQALARQAYEDLRAEPTQGALRAEVASWRTATFPVDR